MRDIHCHILPGVDDGAPNLEESLRMVQAARAAGVTSMVCTPHCRRPYFDYKAMWEAYFCLREAAPDMPMQMGFEVNIEKLRELGMGWAPHLGCGRQDPGEQGRAFLLELSVGATPRDFQDYEREIFELQGMGFRVVIAHPERYLAIRKDPGLAQRLVDMGCALQASADFVRGGRLGGAKGIAKRLLKAGLYSHIASDAHCPRHYEDLSKAYAKYGEHLRAGHMG